MLSNSSINRLDDADVLKIAQLRLIEFNKSISEYNLPTCQKALTHFGYPLLFVLLNPRPRESSFMNIFNINGEKNLNSYNLEPVCEKCLAETNNLPFLDFKGFLTKTFNVANSQCTKNSYQECIEPTVQLLEDSLQCLTDTKEKLQIYIDEVQQKIEKLKAKSATYPPFQVREIIERIESSKDKSEDEKNLTLQSELNALGAAILFDQSADFTASIPRAQLDFSLYYVLAQKLRCDVNVITQCIDRGCYILNDIDQSDNNPRLGERITRFLHEQQPQLDEDQSYVEYKKKMEFVGLQEPQLILDRTIDYASLYKYEKFKFQGGNSQQLKYDRSSHLIQHSRNQIKPTIISKSPLQKALINQQLYPQSVRNNRPSLHQINGISFAGGESALNGIRKPRIFEKENIQGLDLASVGLHPYSVRNR